jgi:hypothetical protein
VAIIAGLGSFAALTTLAQSSDASLVAWGDYRALAFKSASRSSALISFLPIAINKYDVFWKSGWQKK